jgi:hypothetical protein
MTAITNLFYCLFGITVGLFPRAFPNWVEGGVVANQSPVPDDTAIYPEVNMGELSIEQEFAVRKFQLEIKDMSREQALDFMVKLYTQMIWQESTYKNLLRQQWGIGK